MNTRAITLSLVIAGMAMFMVYSYLDSREAYYKAKYGEEKSVVIAREDIKELDIIDDTKVTMDKKPENFLSPGHFRSKEDVLNRIALTPIKKGEQITDTKISQPNSRTGLSRQISAGRRGFALTVDQSQSVSQLIKPGDRVDILFFLDYAGGRKDMQKTLTVLQDVLVLSTGLNMTNAIPLVQVKESENSNEMRKVNLNRHVNYNTVTLELTPYEAQKLIWVIGSGGRPYLSLRNNDDKERERLSSTKIFDLLGDDADDVRKFFKEQQAR